jgi:hypothetical protein
VVSLREVIDTRDPPLADTNPERFKAALNWEKSDLGSTGLGLVPSELVTGSMALFDGQLFFATFIAINPGGDACDLGRGRIFGVHYLNRDTTGIDTAPFDNGGAFIYGPQHLTSVAETVEGEGVINVTADNAIENLMIIGLGVSQRPTCSVVDPSPEDVYGATINPITAIEDPAVYLVAQASGTASEATQRAASQLGSLELRLNRPVSVSRVTSWATSVD